MGFDHALISLEDGLLTFESAIRWDDGQADVVLHGPLGSHGLNATFLAQYDGRYAIVLCVFTKGVSEEGFIREFLRSANYDFHSASPLAVHTKGE
jgi:hypothetical protein